jgi:hypothetical protein
MPDKLHSFLRNPMAIVLSGACVRMALMDRRSELLRCASITKDNTFDEKIKDLDDALMQIWDSKEVMILPEVPVA